jgi:hypothetical protein
MNYSNPELVAAFTSLRKGFARKANLAREVFASLVDDYPFFLDDEIDEDELERLDVEASIPSAAERNS